MMFSSLLKASLIHIRFVVVCLYINLRHERKIQPNKRLCIFIRRKNGDEKEEEEKKKKNEKISFEEWFRSIFGLNNMEYAV